MRYDDGRIVVEEYSGNISTPRSSVRTTSSRLPSGDHTMLGAIGSFERICPGRGSPMPYLLKRTPSVVSCVSSPPDARFTQTLWSFTYATHCESGDATSDAGRAL